MLYNGVPAGDLILGGGEILQNSQANSQPYEGFQNLVINPGASAMYQAGRGANELPAWDVSNNVTRVVGGVLDISSSGKAGSHAGLYFEGTNSPDGTNDYGSNGILGGWATYALNDWEYANNANTTAAGNSQYYLYQANNSPADWGATSNVPVGLGSGVPITITIPGNTVINSLKLTNAAPVTINNNGTLTLSSGGLLSPVVSAGFFRTQSTGVICRVPKMLM